MQCCRIGDRVLHVNAAKLDLVETALRAWTRRSDIERGKEPPNAITTEERLKLALLLRRAMLLIGAARAAARRPRDR